jgi:hypothetical protein
MKPILVVLMMVAQFGPRVPLTPAQTLLEPDILLAIERASVDGPGVTLVPGADASGGEIALVCRPNQCEVVQRAARRLGAAISAKRISQPARTIRVVASDVSAPPADTKAAIFVAPSRGATFQIVRGLWSTAAIGDEVVEIFARQAVNGLEARSFDDAGQPPWDPFGVPTTAIVPPADTTGVERASFIAAASAYFLATLPNAGSEALLSHLTVGAHARLAEDGRKAVAQMGSQQRASAEVLIMFGQAIEREQRRMRSFAAFMPAPIDPMLRSRIADMEKGITSVWTSIGITSSPFVPAAERIRGRGGEDRRVPSRVGSRRPAPVEPPTAFLTFDHPADILHELGNFIDGKRSISDIRDAVSAEFGALPLPSVVDYFDRLAASGAITIR